MVLDMGFEPIKILTLTMGALYQLELIQQKYGISPHVRLKLLRPPLCLSVKLQAYKLLQVSMTLDVGGAPQQS